MFFIAFMHQSYLNHFPNKMYIQPEFTTIWFLLKILPFCCFISFLENCLKMIHTSEFKINNGEKLQEIIPECCFQSYFCCPQPLLVTISSSKSPLIGHKLTISSSPLQAVDVSSESNHSLPTSTISLFRSPGCRWYLTTSSYGAAKVLQQLPGHRA